MGTIATVYAMTNFIDTEELELIGEGNAVAVAMGITKVAALGAMNSEMKSAKWLWGAVALQLSTGFIVGFLVYQIGTLVTTGALGAGFVGGLIFIIIFAAIVTFLIKSNQKQIALEYKLD
mgnify:CR=1 FL=1